jgi:hypothetical protein
MRPGNAYDAGGQPLLDTQPRFGIYRDALPGSCQAINFLDIAFSTTNPAGDATWAGIRMPTTP